MVGYITLKPFNIEELQSIKDEVYSNGCRFSIKPKGAVPHITIGQFDTENADKIKKIVQELSMSNSFTIDSSEWLLTKKFHKANQRFDKDYYWIALLFENNEKLMDLYRKADELMSKYSINDNRSYINNVKEVKKITDGTEPSLIDDKDCIANHLNISNYTRPEKADECWSFVSSSLPKSLRFGVLSVAFAEKGGPEIEEYNLSVG